MGGVRFEYGIELVGQILTQHTNENPRRKDEEVNSLRSPMNKLTSRSVKQATCAKRQDTEEDDRDMQVKKKGNIQVKQPSPPHSMHCTNLASHCRHHILYHLRLEPPFPNDAEF